ncbi:MAG: hypothetical protein Q8O83_04090 [bacterium]|nr:hypothetical protein [bacterium]
MEKFEKNIPSEEEMRELKKTRYFSHFATTHLAEMRILKKGGVLGKENRDWRNISEHCLVEAVGADILAEYMGADRKNIVSAALLHDWYKRNEIEAMKKLGGAKGHRDAAEKEIAVLQKMGIPENIIHLMHANIPQRADIEYLEKRTREEKIMHFIDLITLNAKFVDIKERIRDASKKKSVVEFCDSYRPRYNGKSLLEVQDIAGSLEQKEFEKILHLEPGTLIERIRHTLNNRIDAY